MLNNNLQEKRIKLNIIARPANIQVKPNISFKGTAYEPLRPEHYMIKFDDEFISSKKLNKKENKSLLSKAASSYRRFMETLAGDSEHNTKKQITNNYPFQYKYSYYA